MWQTPYLKKYNRIHTETFVLVSNMVSIINWRTCATKNAFLETSAKQPDNCKRWRSLFYHAWIKGGLQGGLTNQMNENHNENKTLVHCKEFRPTNVGIAL